MPRPRKIASEVRNTRFLLRLTYGERINLKRASQRIGKPMAEILRQGAELYIKKHAKAQSSNERTLP